MVELNRVRKHWSKINQGLIESLVLLPIYAKVLRFNPGTAAASKILPSPSNNNLLSYINTRCVTCEPPFLQLTPSYADGDRIRKVGEP